MQPLLILKDKDIYPDADIPEDQKYELRKAVKAIVFDADGCIALVGHTHRLLPGGGVEDNETLEDAIKRECKEEIGCDILIEKEIGFTEEYRAKINRHQETHFFITHVKGEKGHPTTIQEDEVDIMTHWIRFDDALKIFEKQISEISPLSYHTNFNARTQLRALQEFSTNY